MAVVPVNGGAHGAVPVMGGSTPGTRLAPSSGSVPAGVGLDYVPAPVPHTKCMVERDDGTKCRGPRAHDTEYCIGHLRTMRALAALELPEEG